MKKQLLCLWVVLCLPVTLLFAQTDTTQYRERVDYYLTNLNKTQIPTQILYDRVFPLAGLQGFNQGGRTDTSSYQHFNQAYFELYQASYNTAGMTTPDALREASELQNVRQEVPIGVLYYNFNTIDEDAINKNQLRIQNNLLYDVSGRSSSPYLARTTLVVAALSRRVKAGNVPFRLNTNFFKTNTGLSITSVAMTLNNYTVNFTPNSNAATFYLPTEGVSVARYVIRFSNNSVFTTYSAINVTGNASAPAARYESEKPCKIETITSTETFQGYDELTPTVGKGEVNYYFSDCSVQTITNPIIILDGFDPTDSRDASKIYKDYLKYNTNNNLVDEMNSAGYQVIILNFHNYEINGKTRNGGADYIERNAYVLAKLIQDVNAKLQAAGSNKKLTIVGPSMGGLISRYALAFMEKKLQQTGNAIWNHNTRLWVSFDSPHLGANIPIGDQWFLDYYKGISAGAKDALNVQINSPAAKQMLIHHYSSNSVAPAGAPSFRSQFVSALDNMGFPQNVRRVALLNGTLNGLNQPQGAACASALELRVQTTTFTKIFMFRFFTLIGLLTTVEPISTGKINFAPANASTCRVFEGYFVRIFGRKTRDAQNPSSYCRSSLDLVQGGSYSAQQDIIDDGTINGLDFKSFASFFSSLLIKTKYSNVVQRHSFIPAASAMALGKGPTPNASRNWADNLSAVDLVCTGETPFHAYYAPSANESHVYLTTASVAWIKNEINEVPQPNTPLIITGDFNPGVCSTTSSTFSVTKPCVGLTYSWTTSDSRLVVTPADQGKPTVTITRNGSCQGCSVSVSYTQGGKTFSISKTLQYGGGGYSSSDYPVSGPDQATCGQTVYYSTVSLPGATNYQWVNIPNNATNVSGQGTRYLSFTVPPNTYGMSVGVRVANACDAGGSPAMKFTSVSCSGFSPYSVYPNPASSQVTVQLKEPSQTADQAATTNQAGSDNATSPEQTVSKSGATAQVKIFDANTQQVGSGTMKDGKISFSTGKLPSGSYFIQILDGDKMYVQQLRIQH